jgi:hypothetical protein
MVQLRCHHSLARPIDWKLSTDAVRSLGRTICHHLLVTPINWKLVRPELATVKLADWSPLAGVTY